MTESRTELWRRRDALLRALFTVLADQPDGMHYRAAVDQVRLTIPPVGRELEPVAANPDQDKYLNDLLWYTVDAVKAGWLVKKAGIWRLTESGRTALAANTQPGTLADAASALYHDWRARQDRGSDDVDGDRWDLARCALEGLPEATWTSYTDIAKLVGTNPSSAGWWVSQSDGQLPNAYRVLQVSGALYDSHSRPQLEAAGIAFLPNGKADPSQRVDAEALREMLGVAEIPPEARRAWLVRGNNVKGHDLVPAWLADGQVTLAAEYLGSVETGIDKDDLKPRVEAGYSFAPYTARRELVDAFHQFLTVMQDGDIVCTIDQGRLFVGRVTGAPRYSADVESGAALSREVQWSGSVGADFDKLPSDLKARLGTQRDVLDLTQYLAVLEQLVTTGSELDAPVVAAEAILPDATSELASELHVDQAWLQKCVDLLRDRPQLIFYGPPGTGKTYIARKLAQHLASDNVTLVQFHPSYSYEDFFEGFRPVASGGFELKGGPLRRVVDHALANPSAAHVLIIDEINRGNLAKVFGELYFLLEYRDQSVELLYSDAGFSLPENVYIIGTMNTADRSIALVDAAMRRRFAFLPLHPSEPPTQGLLRAWLTAGELPTRNADLLDELNARIDDPDFKIGPSYLMRNAVYADGGRELAWETAILPLLEEHHFGELDRAAVAARYGLDAIARRVDGALEAMSQEPDGAPSSATS